MWGGIMGTLLYTPILNLLAGFYVVIPGSDLGLAIIALTLLIRLILHPSYARSLKAQRDLQNIQPFIDKIRTELKDDSQAQSQAIMKVYQEHKINPLSSCLPLLIQLPIVLALYRVFIAGLNDQSLTHLYSWFPNAPVHLNATFLGLVDLSTPSITLAILTGLTQAWQSWLSMKYNPSAKIFPVGPKNLIYIFPVITALIALTLPAALGLYWSASTVIMGIEQLIIYRRLNRQTKDLTVITHP